MGSVVGPTVVYAASPGEANVVGVESNGLGILITDAGAPITPGPGCSSVSEHSISCPINPGELVSVDLGDLDDSFGPCSGGPCPTPINAYQISGGEGSDVIALPANSSSSNLEGGSGNDQLTGGDDGDIITGGAGDDLLDSGGGRPVRSDSLNGDQGDDILRFRTGTGYVSGGEGVDLVDYSFATNPHTIQLGGFSGNTLSGRFHWVFDDVENAIGGRGGDLIIGSGFANTLEGGPGGDVIEGGGGDDEILTNDGEPDQVACGSGSDLVVGDETDLIAEDCESVQIHPVDQLPIGTHDAFSGEVVGPDCFAAGWAVDPDDLATRIAVRISADGSLIGETTADLFRQDLIDAGASPDGLAGFSFDLRGHISIGEAHTILVEGQDAQTAAWQPLDETPKVINCADSPPEGTHDGVDGTQPPWTCVANGWAVDPDDRTARLTVQILVDGQEVTSTVADLFRQDLIDAAVSLDGLAGFTVNLWGLMSHGTRHEIRVQAQDNETGEWSDVDSTPMILSCSVPSPSSGIGFTGLWTATDLDGSPLTMHIGPGDTPQVTYYDSYSTVCDNNASPTWVGAGKGEFFEIWLFVSFNRPGCDPLVLQLYWDKGSDTLWEDEDGDGVGITWSRKADV
jgi:hypothetical protein